MIFIGIAIGLALGILLSFIYVRKTHPYAGIVLIDTRRDCEDTISIQGTKNLSKWQYKKHLIFDVEVKG